MRRCRIDEPPVFLRVLAVIALRAGEPEDPLLQDRVDAIPEGECHAEQLMLVAEAAETVLAPAKRSRPCMLMGKVVPRVAACAVVLAHGAPGSLAEVRPPTAPGGGVLAEPPALGVIVAHVRFATISPEQAALSLTLALCLP